jgi:two-component system CheB/CheR fusion protein
MKKPARSKRRLQDTAAAIAGTPSSPPANDARRAVGRGVRIVGIGTSAGGLEALELFLRNVPKNSGLAFAIVQHLDPTRKGALPELLQRVTPMKVVEAQDGTPVRRDCVYVIPPNKDMSILHGVLHLLDPVAPRGLRLPIDSFFRSLADDSEERSIGVLLSGMGTDGTLGLRSIKAKAGVVFVQDPVTAKFDGMPRSAIDAGLADIVAPAEELPGKIAAYLQHPFLVATSRVPKEDDDHNAFEKIVILLREQTGHDVSFYKKNTVHRRVERRMSIHQIHGIAGRIPRKWHCSSRNC